MTDAQVSSKCSDSEVVIHSLYCFSQGRNPFYVEPAMVICITDGSKLSSQSGVQDEV